MIVKERYENKNSKLRHGKSIILRKTTRLFDAIGYNFHFYVVQNLHHIIPYYFSSKRRWNELNRKFDDGEKGN